MMYYHLREFDFAIGQIFIHSSGTSLYFRGPNTLLPRDQEQGLIADAHIPMEVKLIFNRVCTQVSLSIDKGLKIENSLKLLFIIHDGASANIVSMIWFKRVQVYVPQNIQRIYF